MLVNCVMQEMSFTAIFYAGPQVSEQQNCDKTDEASLSEVMV